MLPCLDTLSAYKCLEYKSPVGPSQAPHAPSAPLNIAMRHSRDVSDIAAEAAEFANTQDALGQSAAQSEKSAAQLERGERYSTAAPLPLDPPPDGGVTAWMTVAGAFLTVFVQFGLSMIV